MDPPRPFLDDVIPTPFSTSTANKAAATYIIDRNHLQADYGYLMSVTCCSRLRWPAKDSSDGLTSDLKGSVLPFVAPVTEQVTAPEQRFSWSGSQGFGVSGSVRTCFTPTTRFI